MEHKTGIITKKEKYCISRWTIIIMRANGQLCFSYIKKYKMNIASNELRNSKRKIAIK